jgi:hypothetical protein
MPLKLMQDKLRTKVEATHYILHKDFGKRKIFLKSFPHGLTEEQNEHRVTTCEDSIQNFSAASLCKMSLRIFSSVPKQNIRA